MTTTNASNELYNLRWNNYFTNLTSVFAEHQNQESLVDVTLGCEGQFIKAHKLVLSACSAYFQAIFQSHAVPQLLILLNDVKFENLKLIVQFMYRGEVKVAESDMPEFLQVGKMLQIKGLCSVELQDKQKTSDDPKPERSAVIEKNKVETNETVPPEVKKNSAVKKTVAVIKSIEKKDTEKDPLAPTAKKRKLSPAPVELKKKILSPPPLRVNTPPPENLSHIPRPPNAFMIFANQWRKKLAVEYPNDSNKGISVRLGHMWKSLSPETRDAFYEDARKADEEHKLKYPGYYYSPQEARHRKAIAHHTKTVQEVDSRGTTCLDFINIKCEEDDEYNTTQDNGS